VAHINPENNYCHSLKYLAKEMLGQDHSSFETTTAGLNIRLVDRDLLLKYNELDTEITLRLFLKFRLILSQEEWEYFENIERPHYLNLLQLSIDGIPFDLKLGNKLSTYIYEYTHLLQREIFKIVRTSFNISSQRELASALFYNKFLVFNSPDGENTPLRPLGLTSIDQIKLDIDSLTELKSYVASHDSLNKDIPNLINQIIQFIELTDSMSWIERLTEHAKQHNEFHKIYPNITANASTGRVIAKQPNILAIPKTILKKSEDVSLVDGQYPEKLFQDIKDIKSIRSLIRVPSEETEEIVSVDINGLDLGIITNSATEFNKNFSWLRFYAKHKDGLIIDSHFGILKEIDPKRYKLAFEQLFQDKNLSFDLMKYWATKPRKKGVYFIEDANPSNSVFVNFKDDVHYYKKLKEFREISKQLNFGPLYSMGASNLALKLKEVMKVDVGTSEAQGMLERLSDTYPEIGLARDKIAHKVYQDGYYTCAFGRRYYADVWDELNQHKRKTLPNMDQYEFMCNFDGKYYYIKARGWVKTTSPVIEDLKLLDRNNWFQFREVLAIEEIEKSIFRLSGRKKKSKFQRKTEDNQEDVSDYELTRIQLSWEIDTLLGMTTSHTRHCKENCDPSFSMTQESQEILYSLVKNGNYALPEKNIIFYRVDLQTPASKYFRFYKPLIKVAKKFFAAFCQSEAADIAKQVLTRVRTDIEDKDLNATIIFFIHDQVDVHIQKSDSEMFKSILTNSVETSFGDYAIRFTGESDPPGPSFK
ncbi:MAG: hypothetical protein HON90_10730, partial [Halobacteriovoraceae bacterium]|nr:hypothetical protein [Halobacteriovoraceae bacterium]